MTAFLKSTGAALFGLAIGLAITALAGENPFHVVAVLARSAFGSSYDLGMTLFYSTPLLMTGLSVAVAFRAGLFNVGAEGQLAFGAFAAAATGILLPDLPWPVAPILAGSMAFLAGAAWGAIAGWLRASRGTHEVIATILMNFIAAGLTAWMTLYWLKNPESQNPETAVVGPGYILSNYPVFGNAPVSAALWLAGLSAVLVWVLFSKTVLGFRLTACGDNPEAAAAAGIRVARMRIVAMALAGGLAGLVGVGEVLGNAGRFRMEFSPGFGFTGIAVALLAKGNPFGVVLGALLFGALHKGSLDLDMETEKVTRDLALVLQACVILAATIQLPGLFRRKSR